MELGPDGCLYIIEWGTAWGKNQDTQIVRIEYQLTLRPRQKNNLETGSNMEIIKQPKSFVLFSGPCVIESGSFA